MATMKKSFYEPEIRRVNLVPQEAVLEVCKNHENGGDVASDENYCSHPGLTGTRDKPCRGVTGS